MGVSFFEPQRHKDHEGITKIFVWVGVGLWGLEDGLAVPLLGPAGGQVRRLRCTLYTLGAHIAYGVATAAVTQVLDKIG